MTTQAKLTFELAGLFDRSMLAAFHECLRTRGVAIVKNVIDLDTCRALSTTLSCEPSSRFTGRNIGQHVALWETRLLLRKLFALVYDTHAKQLISSIDGAVYTRGGEGSGAVQPPHVDVEPFSKELQKQPVFQSVVTLASGSGPGAGGTTVWPGSHLRNEELYRKGPRKQTSFNVLPEDKRETLSHECPPVQIISAVGSVTFFSSFLTHAGRMPSDGSVRCVVFVCMVPRYFTWMVDLKKLHEAYEHGLQTTHLPTSGAVGTKTQPRPPIALQNKARHLMGLPSCESASHEVVDLTADGGEEGGAGPSGPRPSKRRRDEPEVIDLT